MMVFSGIQGIGTLEVVGTYATIDRHMPDQEFQSPTTQHNSIPHTPNVSHFKIREHDSMDAFLKPIQPYSPINLQNLSSPIPSQLFDSRKLATLHNLKKKNSERTEL
jgi:hypothetical protein